MSDLDELRTLRDRAAVRDVVEGYMSAVDRNDYDAMAGCFTDDAELNYAVEPHRFTGGAEFAEWMRNFDAIPTTHTLSNCRISVDGDAASSDMFGFAAIVVGESGPGSIQMVGLRYVDDLVRGADGSWRIARRTHSITWQVNSAAEPIGLDID